MGRPAETDTYDLTFGEMLPLREAAEVALEDYARVLTGAAGAEALRGAEARGPVSGVRLTAPAAYPSPAQRRDIEDFARALSAEDGGNGLGWA